MIYYDILSELKYKTKVLHNALEEVSYAKEIMAGTISKQQYIDVLLKSKWIYNQIEPLLNRQLQYPKNASLKTFLSERSSHLETDITALNYDSSEKNYPSISYRLEENTLSELIGILYVLEGARLGGKVIIKALKKNKNLGEIDHFNFYSQEGIDTGPRWKLFILKAREIVTKENDGDRAIEAASRIFHYFHQVHSFQQ